MRETRPLLLNSDFPAIARQRISSLQVNLGYRCNLSCVHCHVNAGPTRTEEMSLATTEQVVELMDRLQPATLDLTGGAPEMNPHFRWLVDQARQRDIEVIDRCNLTILLEPGYEDLAEFMAAQGVVITASLPCYEEENVAEQRGQGVYSDSIQALQLLNKLGYGVGEDLQLNLVYNPTGTNLPPPQEQLQSDYKRELQSRFGISFDALFTITNMPISRFGAVLLSQDQYYPYMRMLRESFATENLDSVMCRELISIDWQGFVYDCDFNQMLDMPVLSSDRRVHVADLLDGHELDNAAIFTAEHCYGCTAGQGSSCSGALDG